MFSLCHQRIVRCDLSQTQIKQRDDGQWQSRVLRSLQHVCLCTLRARLRCGFSEPLGGVLLLRHSGSLLGRPKGLEIIYQVSKGEAALSFFPSVATAEGRARLPGKCDALEIFWLRELELWL